MVFLNRHPVDEGITGRHDYIFFLVEENEKH